MGKKKGGGKVIPSYTEPINSPYANNNPNTYDKSQKSTKELPGPYIKGGPTVEPSQNDNMPQIANNPIYSAKPNSQPLIDLQIYPDPKTKNPLADKQASLPLQPFSLSSPFIPPQFQSYLNNFMKNFYTPFIYKDYHINLGGPDGDITRGSMIYEDVLPSPDIYSSYKTLKERNYLLNYLRGTFIMADEGEFIDFSGGPNSLNSRLKLIQLNPYNSNLYSSNPYKNLPKGLLIYTSCYPIVYDKASTMVQCNKSSVGLNVRVYELTLKEFVVKYLNSPSKMDGLKTSTKIRPDLDEILNMVKKELGDKTLSEYDSELNPIKYDVWREVDFYAYIRDKINLQMICPNFVQSYCYFINKKANISFNKNGLNAAFRDKTIPELLMGDKSNCTMVLLTESPNKSIYQWGSNEYVKDKGIQKMVYSGFKPDTHWKSVIAQMLIIFYVMDKYLFTVREMEPSSNFFVKNLNVFGDNKQYWQYNIGGIDFYIPNYGYLLMFDHDYKDLKSPENIASNARKVISVEAFGDDIVNIKKTIVANALNCFSSNNFGDSFHQFGGVGLSDKIKDIFDHIHKDIMNEKTNLETIGSNTWTELIKKNLIYMGYINNRVGTPIRDLEVQYIRKSDSRPKIFKSGELVIYEEKFETYKILMIYENNNPNSCNCVGLPDETIPDSSNLNYEIKPYPKDLLYKYSEYETIKQDVKPGEPMIGQDNIIEKYTL